jgi:hypothetical protein
VKWVDLFIVNALRELLGRRFHYTYALRASFHVGSFVISGERMNLTMKFDQSVPVTISGVDASGNPSKAALSALVLTSSDVTLFTVAPDPTNPLGGIVTGVKVTPTPPPTLNFTATATEADGTAHQVSGSATVTLTPDFPPTVGLVATFGTPMGPATPTPTPSPAP